MINKYFTLFLLCGLISTGVTANDKATINEKISDKNAFETQYIKCIEQGLKAGCFQSVFSGHFDFQPKQELLAPDAENFFIRWMAGLSIYKVHVASKIVKADIFDNRSYLIERSDGELVGFFVGFRSVKGNWYVYDIQGGSSDLYIRRLLEMPKIRPLDVE